MAHPLHLGELVDRGSLVRQKPPPESFSNRLGEWTTWISLLEGRQETYQVLGERHFAHKIE